MARVQIDQCDPELEWMGDAERCWYGSIVGYPSRCPYFLRETSVKISLMNNRDIPHGFFKEVSLQWCCTGVECAGIRIGVQCCWCSWLPWGKLKKLLLIIDFKVYYTHLWCVCLIIATGYQFSTGGTHHWSLIKQQKKRWKQMKKDILDVKQSKHDTTESPRTRKNHFHGVDSVLVGWWEDES